jgi:hypothetical protein
MGISSFAERFERTWWSTEDGSVVSEALTELSSLAMASYRGTHPREEDSPVTEWVA